MGHFSLKNVPADTMPRDLALGVTLKPLPPEPGEPVVLCKPFWVGWSSILNPETISETSLQADWTIDIGPDAGTDTCGKCIEWELGTPIAHDGVSGASPVVTLSPHPTDCRRVIATVTGQTPVPLKWQLLFYASIEGQPFGREHSLFIDLPTPMVHEWTGQVEDGGAPTVQQDVHYPTFSDGLGGGLWNVVLKVKNVYDPGLFTWGESITTDGGGPAVFWTDDGHDPINFWMTSHVQFDDITAPTPGDDNWSISFAPVYDGQPLDPTPVTLSKVP